MTGGAAVGKRSGATAEQPGRRSGPVARRAGFLIAAAVNGIIWYLANVHPTWHAVSFLTADTSSVLPLFNLSLAATVVANLESGDCGALVGSAGTTAFVHPAAYVPHTRAGGRICMAASIG